MKSPPELWAECSDAASLARHLEEFGEIRITRLEAETAVAWEGERASGTVRLEPSGWGTRVILTAHAASEVEGASPGVAEAVSDEPQPDVEPEPDAGAESDAGPEDLADAGPRRRGLVRWLIGLVRQPARGHASDGDDVTSETDPASSHLEAEVSSEAVPAASDTVKILNAALESLGQAHHRPYSRA